MGFEREMALLGRVAWALALVGALIPLVAFLLKRKQPAAATGSDAPRLLGQLDLGQGMALLTVEADGRRYLLCRSAQGVEVLDSRDGERDGPMERGGKSIPEPSEPASGSAALSFFGIGTDAAPIRDLNGAGEEAA